MSLTATGWSLVQGVLPIVNRSGDWKTARAHKGCRAIQKIQWAKYFNFLDVKEKTGIWKSWHLKALINNCNWQFHLRSLAVRKKSSCEQNWLSVQISPTCGWSSDLTSLVSYRKSQWLSTGIVKSELRGRKKRFQLLLLNRLSLDVPSPRISS
jgi:hypothetical protein